MKNIKYRKNLLLLSVFLFLVCFAYSCKNTDQTQAEQVPVEIEETQTESKSGYDAELAEKFGADQYGMKKYVIAFLKRGPNQDLDSLKKVELQTAHMENISRMAEEGKLVLAGPFFGNDDLRGIYVFDVPSVQDAEALTNSDPAIQSGSLVMELREWYGSAALVGINETHKTLMKNQITEN